MRCDNCNKVTKHGLSVRVYNTPWDKPTKYHFCSDICKNQGLFEKDDFRYFICDDCQRIVCEQNPGNGYHIQYHDVYDKQICLSCYEKSILKDGIPIEFFEDSIPGMFFNEVDLEDAGYHLYKSYFIKSQESINNLKNDVKALYDKNKVVINYDSLALGGSEGHVELWIKRK